jgi:hopanoid biosynthesis associated RND transporter like protein HpnN
MLNRGIARIVDFCARNAWAVFTTALALVGGSLWYADQHFAINTDVTQLLSRDLPWRKRELDLKAAFPQEAESIIAVVQGPTPELSWGAAKGLADRLSAESSLFHSVQQAGGGEFFARNSLLYLATDEVAQKMQQLERAAPIIKVLAGDSSLRGLTQAILLGLQGIDAGFYPLDTLERPLDMAAEAVESVLAGQPATFSWKVLVNGEPAKAEDLRSLLVIWPVLDFSILEPGRPAATAIRRAAQDGDLQSSFLSTVQLTGPIPIADQQFATLREGIGLNGVVSSGIVLLILWLALRSLRIVIPVILTVLFGLAITAALGLFIVGALNPISVAFVVLFVGLGADFAIQFSVRYRTERHLDDRLRTSLVSAGSTIGPPLTLAAAAAAAGFLSFLPTSYRGVAELGLIAGSGMVVAFVASVTLLPALLRLFAPPTEPWPMGYAGLAPVDHFLQRHRFAVVAVTSIVVLAGLPLLPHLQFDFSPTSLQDQNSEAVKALKLLRQDPRLDINTAEVLVPASDVDAVSRKLVALPEVSGTKSLQSFVPGDQDRKLALIQTAASSLDPALQVGKRPAPSDAEDIAALNDAARKLREAAGESEGPGAKAAQRLADDLTKLAGAEPALREKVAATLAWPLKQDLGQLSQSLHPGRIDSSNLPGDIRREWVASDGRRRVEIVAQGDANNSDTLRRFASAVLAAEPNATGQAIETYEWGRTIIVAFLQAGVWALCSIAILLWIVLRRLGDVLLTLIPLLAAAVLTLEICALTGFGLNYANIIALPVLLGVGVAFKIYYVMAWRRGESDFLQSSLTRAVFFSALMTATAFGSLWFSRYVGMSSMGKLLALSLACTLASAALFQPALMGPPRKENVTGPGQS